MAKVVRRQEVFRSLEADFEQEEDWITIVREGQSENGRNYRRSTLERAVEAGIYNGARMFVDHTDGPPLKRSIQELVSGIAETKLDTSFPDGRARVRGRVEWFNDQFKDFAHRAKQHIGVSHDAMLRGFRRRVNGRKYEDIEEIKAANSVDWVVYPSAGGGFEQFYAKEGVEMSEAIDWDAIDEEMLKEKAPELYKSLTAKRATEGKQKQTDDEEEDEEVEEEGKESRQTSKQLDEKAVESIVMRALESVGQKRAAREETTKKVEAMVNRSTLPDLTKQRVIKQFSTAESFEEDAVKEAIEDAKKEVSAIAGPRVSGMGPTGNGKVAGSTAVAFRAHEAVASAFGIKANNKKEKE